VVALSSDERLVFVSNQWSDSVTVLAAGAAGALELVGTWPTGSTPCGIAVRPMGGAIYVAAAGAIEAHGVGPDGALTWRQSLPFAGAALNGIVHLELPGGEFVYALDNGWPNRVTRFAVRPDGALEPAGAYAVGEQGTSGYFGSPRLVAAGRRLFAVNRSAVGALVAADDGSLSPAPGSPYPVAAPSGALAVDPTGSWVFVGTDGGYLERFAVGEDGAIVAAGTYDLGVRVSVAGLAVHPSGRFLVASFPYARSFATFDLAQLAPADGSPTASDAGSAAAIGGMVFDREGHLLFVGNGNGVGTSVSVYGFAALPELTAAVEVHPETLNLRSNGKDHSITVLVEGANVPRIAAHDPAQLTLSPSGGAPVAATPHPAWGEADWNRNGVPDLLVKFDRQELASSIAGAALAGGLDLSRPVALTLSAGGVEVGTDLIRVHVE
jgi:DNA-binding beta-propeller fold protein YncE